MYPCECLILLFCYVPLGLPLALEYHRRCLEQFMNSKLGFPAGVKHLVVVFMNAAGREMELLIRLATVQ